MFQDCPFYDSHDLQKKIHNDKKETMDPFQVWLPAMTTHTKSIAGGHWWAIEKPITAHDLKSVYTLAFVGGMGRLEEWAAVELDETGGDSAEG